MISVSDALSILSKYVVRTDVETAPLQEAVGRTVFEDIAAQLTLPPHDASAMDG